VLLALALTVSAGSTPLRQAKAGAQKALAITPAPAFTADQLNGNSGNDWLTVGGGLNDNRDSTLNAINTTNVSGLKQAWTGSFGLTGAGAKQGEEGAAVTYAGILYIPDSDNAVEAIDGTTGATLWKYSPVNDEPALLPAVRGLAMGNGLVYEGQTDGNIVALNQTTGAVVWKSKIGNPSDGIQFTSAPVYYDGMIFEGASGGDWGGRSFAIALDAATGLELWRWYVAPSPGELGSGTWNLTDWERGGGAIWIYPSIDTTTGLLYLVTGNPVPWNGRGAGDNLWTDSIVALHVQNGQFAWGFQTVHHDLWDFDVTNPPVLYNGLYGGASVPALAVASKTGWVYILNRENGKPILGIPEKKVPQLKGPGAKYANLSKTQPYPVGQAFTNQCTTRKDWPGKAPDGHPYIVGCIFTPYAYTKTGSTFLASVPSDEGGVDWQPPAYNPATGYTYLCSITGPGASIGAIPNAEKAIIPGTLSVGASFGPPSPRPNLPQLVAVNTLTNTVAWKVTQPSAAKPTSNLRCTGAMTTAGGLVFASQTDTSQLAAYSAATGALLWTSPKLPTAPGGPPITYSVNGVQYVAILGTGGNIYAFSL
jgi:PQQ-dependent dehydrogenase (methanol/ethanol family)